MIRLNNIAGNWPKPVVLIVTIGLLLHSCSFYKNGLLQNESPSPTNFDRNELNRLSIQKESLNKESIKIVANINHQLSENQPIHATTIHQLFFNLSRHYAIDSVYRAIYTGKGNNSAKLYSLHRLMLAADFYYDVFQSNRSIRRIINRGDMAYHIPKNSLKHSLQILYDTRNKRIAKQQQWHLSSNKLSGYKFRMEQRKDKITELAYQFAGACSQTFGQLAAKVHTKPHPENNLKRLMPQLRKWDIVCQKYPNCLTDRFIPGYFGHVGIYLGGGIFAESIQEGVTYSKADKFAEGRAYIILRLKKPTEKQNRDMKNHLKIQVGKKYDFNFNIESPDQLVCTELIYLVYDQINWETKEMAGRTVISPDLLVQTALKNESLKIPLYFDQEEYIVNPNSKFISALISE